MAYGDFNDLPRRTAFYKLLRDKTFNIAENPKCKRGLPSVFYIFLIKTFLLHVQTNLLALIFQDMKLLETKAFRT